MSESDRDTCTTVAEDLVAYVDGELVPAAHEAVARHVGGCLSCRREVEGIKQVGRLVEGLPGIEPSADFAAGLERRLTGHDGSSAPGQPAARRMPAWPFAAAAAVTLALGSMIARNSYQVAPLVNPAPSEQSHAAAVAAAPAAAPAPMRRAAAPAPAGGQAGRDASAAAVSAAELMPEDLPPDLLERPELYLRLPVVRRLEKLEHFEEVRHQGEGDRVGKALPSKGAARTWG